MNKQKTSEKQIGKQRQDSGNKKFRLHFAQWEKSLIRTLQYLSGVFGLFLRVEALKGLWGKEGGGLCDNLFQKFSRNT